MPTRLLGGTEFEVDTKGPGASTIGGLGDEASMAGHRLPRDCR
jgi:hypothetical protein